VTCRSTLTARWYGFGCGTAEPTHPRAHQHRHGSGYRSGLLQIPSIDSGIRSARSDWFTPAHQDLPQLSDVWEAVALDPLGVAADPRPCLLPTRGCPDRRLLVYGARAPTRCCRPHRFSTSEQASESSFLLINRRGKPFESMTSRSILRRDIDQAIVWKQLVLLQDLDNACSNIIEIGIACQEFNRYGWRPQQQQANCSVSAGCSVTRGCEAATG
jgi:hypothetical protein